MQFSHRRLARLDVLEQPDLPEFLPHELFRRVTKQFGDERVGVGDRGGVGIEDQDAVFGRLEQPTIADLGNLQGRFPAFAVGNVHRRHRQPCDFPAYATQRLDSQVVVVVGAAEFHGELTPPRHPALKYFSFEADQGLGLLRRQQFVVAVSDDFCGVERGMRVTNPGVPQVEVRRVHQDAGVLENHLKPRLALPQKILGLLAGGDVTDGGDKSGGCAIGGTQRAEDRLDM